MYSKDPNGKYRNTAIVDRYGNKISINYTSSKIEVENNIGGKITITKDLDNNVKATDGSGREVTYKLNDKKELIEVTDALGLKNNYEYSNKNIVKINETTEKGTITTAKVEYDKSGRIFKYTDATNKPSYNYYEDVYMDECNEVLGIAGNLRRCVVNAKGQETVTPYVVFENGFTPKGINNDALLHTKSNSKAGNFISTTDKFELARDGFACKNGYVYFIETNNYVDINATYGAKAYFPEQFEFSVPGGIKPSEVKGAYAKQGGKIVGSLMKKSSY